MKDGAGREWVGSRGEAASRDAPCGSVGRGYQTESLPRACVTSWARRAENSRSRAAAPQRPFEARPEADRLDACKWDYKQNPFYGRVAAWLIVLNAP